MAFYLTVLYGILTYCYYSIKLLLDKKTIRGAWFYIWMGIGLIYVVYVIVFFYELYKKCCARNRG